MRSEQEVKSRGMRCWVEVEVEVEEELASRLSRGRNRDFGVSDRPRQDGLCVNSDQTRKKKRSPLNGN